MSREQVLGIVRHVLTAGGGILVTLGYGNEQAVTAGVGALVTVVGVLWSIFDKRK